MPVSALESASLTAPLAVSELIQDMRAALQHSTGVAKRLVRDFNTVKCRWKDQNDDGTKPDSDVPGARVLPWPKSSDAIVRIADTTIGDLVDVCLVAQSLAAVDVIPLGETDPQAAGVMGAVLAHYMHGPMRENWAYALPRVCRFAHQFGVSLIRIEWEERHSVEKCELSGNDLLSLALQMAADSVEQLAAQDAEVDPDTVARQTESSLRAMLVDPERADEVAALLVEYDPDMDAREARRVATRLRKIEDFEESVDYHCVAVLEKRPVLRVLRPWIDCFFPPDAKEIHSARWVAESHWFSRAEVEERAEAEGWDEEVTQEVLAHPGRALGDIFGAQSVPAWILGGVGVNATPSVEWMQDRYQILEVFTRPMTDAGAPAVFRTVLHTACGDKPLLHEVYDRDHGTFPFRGYTALEDETYLIDHRSVAEIVRSEQAQQKRQVDGWRNNVDLRTLPPFTGPIMGTDATAGPRIAPGKFLPVLPGAVGSGYSALSIPTIAQESLVVMQESRARVAAYFGLPHPEVPDAIQKAKGQRRVDRWLGFVSSVVDVLAQLIQQFTDDVTTSRVAGVQASVTATAEDIRGRFLFRFSADIESIDPERKEKKLETLTKLLALDTEAIADRAELFRRFFAQFDPAMAQAVLRDPAQAAQNEAEDEQRAITTILSGQEPLQKKGQNHSLRLQMLQTQATQNSVVMAALQQNETIAAIYQARLKFHQQEVTQQENASIGRNEGGMVMGGPMGGGGA